MHLNTLQYNTCFTLEIEAGYAMPPAKIVRYMYRVPLQLDPLVRVSSPFGTIVKLITDSSSSHVLKHFYHHIHVKCTLNSQVVAIYHIVSTCMYMCEIAVCVLYKHVK